MGLPGPHPGFLSFHDERNQRRAGAVPLDPLRGARCPPCGVAAPPNRVSTTNPDRFATLRWVGESVFFSPQALPGVTLPAFKPWRAGWGEPMVRVASAWQVGQTGGSCSLQSGWGAQAADSFSLIQQKNCWMPGGQYRPYIAARTDWVRALPI